MTQITFRDNKFWIDGMEITNPEVLPFYFKDIRDGIWYYTQEHNHPMKDGETFSLPENLSYEVACNYDCCNENGACEHCQKPVIRLKLKEMKNETPEGGVGKPDQQEFEKYDGLRNSILYAANNWRMAEGWTTHLAQINTVLWGLEHEIQKLQKENEELNKFHGKRLDVALNQLSETQSKISDLEAHNNALEDWKEGSIKVWSPILDYMHEHSGLKVGQSISEEVLRRCKQFSNLEAQLVKANEEIENMKSLAHDGLRDECIAEWDEVKFCPHRQGHGNQCKHCSNYK